MYTPKEHHGKPYTIRQLIERLEDIASDYDDQAPVRIMSQPKWPFEYTVAGLAVSTEFGNDDDGAVVIYIVEGSQIGYGSKEAWDAASK
jgi:hypothetical protein